MQRYALFVEKACTKFDFFMFSDLFFTFYFSLFTFHASAQLCIVAPLAGVVVLSLREWDVGIEHLPDDVREQIVVVLLAL
jgi:hypothetical protein